MCAKAVHICHRTCVGELRGQLVRIGSVFSHWGTPGMEFKALGLAADTFTC